MVSVQPHKWKWIDAPTMLQVGTKGTKESLLDGVGLLLLMSIPVRSLNNELRSMMQAANVETLGNTDERTKPVAHWEIFRCVKLDFMEGNVCCVWILWLIVPKAIRAISVGLGSHSITCSGRPSPKLCLDFASNSCTCSFVKIGTPFFLSLLMSFSVQDWS